MPSIKLITDQVKIYYCEKNSLINYQSFVVPLPEGDFYIVGFCEHALSSKKIPSIVKEAINSNIGVVYVCDILPEDLILDKHIVYVETGWAWFLHTLFTNPFIFKGSFYSGQGERLSKGFSTFTQFKIPQIKSISDIKDLSKTVIKSKNSVLFYIEGGVGDHLLTTPTLKTYKEKGFKIGILVDKHRLPCYENLDFIDEKFVQKSDIKIGEWENFFHLHFGRILNDYSLPLNQQNRIFSVANFCKLKEEELTTKRPIISLTQTEKRWAKEKIGDYPNKLFFGFDSARREAVYPPELTQSLIDLLTDAGYTVIISSLQRKEYKNCINFTGNDNLRFLFALINECDYVLTVDSAFLHIAGAFEKPIIFLPSSIKAEWRASTYKNCIWIEPKVKCYYCLHGQRTPFSEMLCKNGRNECLYSIPQEEILKTVKKYFPLKKKIKVIKKSPDILIIENDLTFAPSKYIGLCRMGGLGDSVMAFYFCRAIQEKYPFCSIDVYLRDESQKELFSLLPRVNPIIPENKNWQEVVKNNYRLYDIFYDAQYYPRVYYNCDLKQQKEYDKNFKWELYNNWYKATRYLLELKFYPFFMAIAFLMKLALSKDHLYIDLPKKEIPNKYITIHNGSDSFGGSLATLKMYPYWNKLVKLLKKLPFEIWQVGTLDDPLIEGVKDLRGKTNIIDLMHILKGSILHIDTEGGVVHLAHLVGTKSVVLFGSTPVNGFAYPDNINIFKNVCKPCWWETPTWSRKCIKGNNWCKNLLAISPEEVFEVCYNYLKKSKKI